MLVVLKLHTDLFIGQPGKLFLGGMGLLFLIAIVSGVVLYWPFTRRLEFGTLRQGKSKRILWLDWHNLLGVITVAWAFVVGGTGVINTWAEPMLDQWRASELASMVASSAGSGGAPSRTTSLDKIVDNAASGCARHGGGLHCLSGNAVQQHTSFHSVHAWRPAFNITTAGNRSLTRCRDGRGGGYSRSPILSESPLRIATAALR